AVRRAVEQVQTLSFELRPSLLDDLGLAAAVDAYVRRQTEAAGLSLGLAIAVDGDLSRTSKRRASGSFRKQSPTWCVTRRQGGWRSTSARAGRPCGSRSGTTVWDSTRAPCNPRRRRSVAWAWWG